MANQCGATSSESEHDNESRVGKRALKFEEEEHAKKQCMMATAGGE